QLCIRHCIWGEIYTGGKFYCTGGWIEARIKTTPHTGNFPAFWMMPQTQLTWPNSGEIDIWEQINGDNMSHHTIHSAWGNKTLGQPDQESPVKTTSAPCTVAQWHVYALEWDQDALKWYVDGVLKFTYKNMHYSDSKYSEEMAWPFSKPFYIILNQSVGNGSWAANPDTSFDYLTEFDYVRVYQKKDAIDYYSTDDGHVSGIEDAVSGSISDPSLPVEYYNLQGIRMDGDNLVPGVYIRRQGHDATKVLIR
ncbi:MAG: glycoside hydrolase family 16 protein, partial [Muribaculaceae bacterium]|nr:glycoside hydrolase family 16 protein [Muribaculaceae bacterium]